MLNGGENGLLKMYYQLIEQFNIQYKVIMLVGCTVKIHFNWKILAS